MSHVGDETAPGQIAAPNPYMLPIPPGRGLPHRFILTAPTLVDGAKEKDRCVAVRATLEGPMGEKLDTVVGSFNVVPR